MDRRKQTVEQAWIGDAVLSLYVRSKILREDQQRNGEKSARMTSNQFLGIFGEPTEVEAQIGRVYERDGLDDAFRFIEGTFTAAFERQELKRRRKN